MWVRTWLTEGTPLQLLHITEKQSGMCPYKQLRPTTFLTKKQSLTCLLHVIYGFQTTPYIRPCNEQPGEYPEGEK